MASRAAMERTERTRHDHMLILRRTASNKLGLVSRPGSRRVRRGLEARRPVAPRRSRQCHQTQGRMRPGNLGMCKKCNFDIFVLMYPEFWSVLHDRCVTGPHWPTGTGAHRRSPVRSLTTERSSAPMRLRNLFASLALATCLLSAGGEVFAQFSITFTVDE